jgi:hypothetical protein
MIDHDGVCFMQSQLLQSTKAILVKKSVYKQLFRGTSHAQCTRIITDVPTPKSQLAKAVLATK